MSINETIKNILKYAQTLHNDMAIYACDDITIKTVERKNLVVNDIALVKANLEALEQILETL